MGIDNPTNITNQTDKIGTTTTDTIDKAKQNNAPADRTKDGVPQLSVAERLANVKPLFPPQSAQEQIGRQSEAQDTEKLPQKTPQTVTTVEKLGQPSSQTTEPAATTTGLVPETGRTTVVDLLAPQPLHPVPKSRPTQPPEHMGIATSQESNTEQQPRASVKQPILNTSDLVKVDDQESTTSSDDDTDTSDDDTEETIQNDPEDDNETRHEEDQQDDETIKRRKLPEGYYLANGQPRRKSTTTPGPNGQPLPPLTWNPDKREYELAKKNTVPAEFAERIKRQAATELEGKHDDAITKAQKSTVEQAGNLNTLANAKTALDKYERESNGESSDQKLEELKSDIRKAHKAVTETGERLGHEAASVAIPHEYETDNTKVEHIYDGRGKGAGHFDDVWIVTDKTSDTIRYVVAECKSGDGELGYRSEGDTRYEQGTQKYFQLTVNTILERSGKGLDSTEMEELRKEKAVARQLNDAMADGRLDYVLVRAVVRKEEGDQLGFGGYKFWKFKL